MGLRYFLAKCKTKELQCTCSLVVLAEITSQNTEHQLTSPVYLDSISYKNINN